MCKFYTVRTGCQALRLALRCQSKMAAQTSRMERDALFVALDDLKAAGDSVALSRVSEVPATTLRQAMELLVAAGHADAVVAALDAAEQQQSHDNLMRLCQQTLEHLAREKVERAAVGEQLLRAAPKDIVGEIQGFAAPAAPEPRTEGTCSAGTPSQARCRRIGLATDPRAPLAVRTMRIGQIQSVKQVRR